MYTTESTARVLNATELRVVKPQKELDLTGMYLCQRKRKST